MVQIHVGVPSCLLSLFSGFAYSLLQLCMLFVDATGMKGLLLFCFVILAFAVVIRLYLFLVICLFLQLHMSIVD